MAHGEKLAGDADSTLDQAEAQMHALDPDAASKSLDDAEASLRDPDVEYYPERGMLRDRLTRDRAAIPQVRAEKAARELAAAVQKQREALIAPTHTLEAASLKLDDPAITADDLKATRAATKDTAAALADGKELEPRDSSYAAEAKLLYTRVARVEARAAVIEKLVDFRDKVAAIERRAQATLLSVKSAKPEARAPLLSSAVDDFKNCADVGGKMFMETPEIEHTKLDVAGTVSTPGAIVHVCSAQLKPLQKKLAAVQRASATKSKKHATRR